MKWYGYLICTILIIIGIFSGISLYREASAESYIVGSIDISDLYSRESFFYSSSSIMFYNDIYDEANTFTFENELLKIDDFDGENKLYKVIFNDYEMINAIVNPGAIFVPVSINFYDVYGNLICEGALDISIKFLNDKTTLSLSTIGEIQKSYFEQYFSDYGFKIKVEEIL